MAVLERGNGRRAFRRIDRAELAERLEPQPPAARDRPAGARRQPEAESPATQKAQED